MTDAPERDPSGRWLPGRSGNPGGRPRNAHRVLLDQIAEELDAATGETALAQILRRLADGARDGDTSAATILLDRLIPKPRGEDGDAMSVEDFVEDHFATLPAWLRALVIAGIESESADPLRRIQPPAWREAVRRALAALAAGADAVDLGQQLDHVLEGATRTRLYRTAVATLGIPEDDLDARLAQLSAEDLDALDRIVTELRTMPIKTKLEKECF